MDIQNSLSSPITYADWEQIHKAQFGYVPINLNLTGFYTCNADFRQIGEFRLIKELVSYAHQQGIFPL
jgi:hypothetical protein